MRLRLRHHRHHHHSLPPQRRSGCSSAAGMARWINRRPLFLLSVVPGLVVMNNACSPVALAQPAGVTGYEATSIGVLPGHTGSSIRAIDDLGRLIGISTAGGPISEVIWINGQLTQVPNPPGTDGCYIDDISRTTGIVVGSASTGQYTENPAVWVIGRGSTTLENLHGGNLTTCTLTAVTDTGLMAGQCTFPTACGLWIRRRPPIDLGGLEHMTFALWATGINDASQITGTGYNDLNMFRPYLWQNGTMIDIGGEPYDEDAQAYGINNLGEVVGDLNTQRKAFYWHDGEITILPEPYPCGDGLREARDINDDGLIVGMAGDADCDWLRPTVWVRDENFTPYVVADYLRQTNPDDPLVLIGVADINSAGQMAMFGETENTFQRRGYLVTPYLFNMSDPVPGGAGAMNTITVTGLLPGEPVRLVWGTEPGAQPVSDQCQGGTLLIRDPRIIPGEVVADNTGTATFNIQVADAARGRTIRLQAVAPTECEISHTVMWTFE